jgi:hypothetical protein
MAVTLKDVRAKREEVRLLRDKVSEASKAASIAYQASRKASSVVDKLTQELQDEERSLRHMGQCFAVDEGEDDVTPKLELPEQKPKPTGPIPRDCVCGRGGQPCGYHLKRNVYLNTEGELVPWVGLTSDPDPPDLLSGVTEDGIPF